ncbi:MAG: signal recognition particle-docking protein FtsY, partial [Litoreibacter sp.]
KLFKSSSKLEEGIDAIVEDGGEEEILAIEASETTTKAAEEVAERARLDEAERLEQERAELERQEAARIEEERLAEERLEAERQERVREEAVRKAAEKAALEKAAAESEAAAQKEALRIAEEQAEREAQEKARAEAEQHAADQQREAARIENAQREQQLAEQEQRARDLKAAQEALRAKEAAAKEAAAQPQIEETTPAAKKPGLFGRLLGRKEQTTVVRRALDDDMLEALEELLIASDMGVDTALRVTANMAEGRMGKKLSTAEIKQLLADEISKIMEPIAKPMPLYPNRPQVVLVVGVNGSGKTTTIGKLALQFQNAGKKVVIAAGDTFRAAAVEQLQVWGERAGVPVLTAPEGSDPASLAYEAMTKAEADGADLLMIDTAGRLQNRSDLMEELAKIVRVIRKKDPSAPHNTLLVLDATTGQNALNQVDIFRQIADVSGLVMTKLDGTAKGGVLVALADKFGLPIHAIGVGEQIDDLDAFDPEEFAQALTGIAVE